MNSILKQALLIGTTVIITLLCNYFVFRSTPAYSQESSPYAEHDMGAIPKNWGRLVDFGKFPTAYMVFEANDGTIRFFYNRKGNSNFKIGDDDMSIEIFKRK